MVTLTAILDGLIDYNLHRTEGREEGMTKLLPLDEVLEVVTWPRRGDS